jgi:hypothetical protein
MYDPKITCTEVIKKLKSVNNANLVYCESHRFCHSPPRTSYPARAGLVITAHSLQITSESPWWPRTKKCYAQKFPKLLYRVMVNHRRKTLGELLLICTIRLTELMTNAHESFIIDSIPLPTRKILREKRPIACRRHLYNEVAANKAFNQILGDYFVGFKIHIIITESDVNWDLFFIPGSTHDIRFLKQFDNTDRLLRGHEMPADRGYVGKATQLRLFQEIDMQFLVIYGRNKKDVRQHNILKKSIRKTMDIVLSQFHDEYTIRSKHAKRFIGFEMRIVKNSATKTLKQFWNYLYDRPINRMNHLLVA